jgi:hypothetical protein
MLKLQSQYLHLERPCNVGYYLNRDYVLMNDIELPNPGQDGMPEEGFIPIGGHEYLDVSVYRTAYFSGIFDCQGFTISNLYIDQPERANVGLFGLIQTEGGVRNLKLNLSTFNSEFSIRGKRNVANVVGASYALKPYIDNPHRGIFNIHVEGGVVRGRYNVGGLIGDVDYVENSGGRKFDCLSES